LAKFHAKTPGPFSTSFRNESRIGPIQTVLCLSDEYLFYPIVGFHKENELKIQKSTKKKSNYYVFLLMEVLNANIMITLPTFYPFALVISDYYSMFLLFSACFLAIST